jgi:hypothetical protein
MDIFRPLYILYYIIFTTNFDTLYIFRFSYLITKKEHMSHDMTTLIFQGFEKCYEKIKTIGNNITIYSLGWINHNLYPINNIHIYCF